MISSFLWCEAHKRFKLLLLRLNKIELLFNEFWPKELRLLDQKSGQHSPCCWWSVETFKSTRNWKIVTWQKNFTDNIFILLHAILKRYLIQHGTGWIAWNLKPWTLSERQICILPSWFNSKLVSDCFQTQLPQVWFSAFQKSFIQKICWCWG